MACINPDGSISTVARKVLTALDEGATLAEAARKATVPLFRVRASVRELIEAGLLQGQDGDWTVTDQGHDALR